MKRFILFLSALLYFSGVYAQASLGDEGKQADTQKSSTQEECEYDDFVITEEFANNINSLNLDYLGNYYEDLAKVSKDGKWGFIDKRGKIVAPILFDVVWSFREGMAAVKKDGKWGFIDKSGKVVIPFQFDGLPEWGQSCGFQEGMAAVEKDGKWGFIDKSGKVVIPFQFDGLSEWGQSCGFHEGMAAVCMGKYGEKKWGFVDKSGKVVVPVQFDRVRNFHGGLAAVYRKGGDSDLMGFMNDGLWSFVDKSGNVVAPFQFVKVKDFNGNFARVERTSKSNRFGPDRSGVLYKSGRTMWFHYIGEETEGMLKVRKDGKWGFIDTSGNVVASIQFGDAKEFQEGMAEVEKDGKWGFIDKRGKIVVPILFDVVWSFSEGMAAVSVGMCDDAKWGFVDKGGKVIVPIQFDSVGSFHEGLAAVEKNGEWGFVDKNGTVVVPVQFDRVEKFQEGLAKVEMNGKNEFVDKNGNVVISIPTHSYIGIGKFHEGLAQVVVAPYNFNEEVVGYVDRYGNAAFVKEIIVRNGWSTVPLYNSTLQYAVNDYNDLLKQYPYSYNENRIAYSLSLDLPNDEKFLQDTLNSLLEIISAKKVQLKERYKNDVLQFKQLNDSLRKKVKESNEQLLNNPYNLQKRTIDDGLSDSLFGRTEELTEKLHHKMSAIPKWQKQIEQEVYEDAKKNNPQRFCEIYFAQNPVQKQFADSIYVECRCKFPGRNAFDIAFIDNTLSDCDCRDKQYQEVSYLYHSREEFDMSYNKEENAFFQEVEGRKKEKRILTQLEETLATQKQLKMKKALASSKQEIIEIVNRVSQHRNGYYYEDAVELLLKYDDKMSKEWEKNGAYFKSKAEMYEYYIGEDYEKALREKRRE